MSTIIQLMREIEEKDELIATQSSELEYFRLRDQIVSTENERLKKRVEQLQRSFSDAAQGGKIAMDGLSRIGNIVIQAVNAANPPLPKDEQAIPFAKRVMP